MSSQLYVEIEVHVRDTQYRQWGEKDDPSVHKIVKIEVPFENHSVLYNALDAAAIGISRAALLEFLGNLQRVETVEDENSSNG